MEQYWDCSLCRIENKGEARRCRSCFGKLRGRDRLLREVARARTTRPVGTALSAAAAGLGQIYQRRWATGIAFGLLVPLAAVLVAATWHGFTYGHLFLLAMAGFLLAVAAVDAYLGPRRAEAPCQRTCPARLAVPDYLQLSLQGDYAQAHALIRTRIPLVGVIGRVCPRPCEDRCVRGIDGEPIAINGCKRFLADARRAAGSAAPVAPVGAPAPAERPAASVGVVGSGPAGLACAYYLSVLGASVVVYEADPVVGGRLATTIPDYRLPPPVLAGEVEDLRARGVDFRPGCPVGPGGLPVADLLRDHAALFLGVGAGESLGLAVPGAEAFLDFQEVLRAAKGRTAPPPAARVAVIGGGDAAVDVCRTAMRLGATEVHLVYRRSRDEMPARLEEVEDVLREGVRLHLLTEPVAGVVEDGVLRGLRWRRVELGAPDASGRRRPVGVPGEEGVLEVDAVIPALGQRVGGGIWADPGLRGLHREPDGRVRVDSRTQRTSLARVYAGGDAVSGPATAILAMAQGRRAAVAIFAAVAGDEVPAMRLTDRRLRQPCARVPETPEAKIREAMPTLALHETRGDFREVEQGLGEAGALREAGRCLQCHRSL